VQARRAGAQERRVAREEAALRALAEKAAKKARAAAEREAKASERQRQRELRKKCVAPRPSQTLLSSHALFTTP